MPTPTRTNHVEVYLELHGFVGITHEQISAQLGIEPTRIYVAGQPVNPKSPWRLSPVNRWLFQTYTKEGPWLDVEQQLDQLLELVSARWEAFEALASYYEVEVKCAVFTADTTESTPPVYLERRHVAMLERLRAEFDVDIYA